MEKYIKGFIQKLNELSGYSIAELEGKAGLASGWCAVKLTGGYARVFVFSELCREHPGIIDTASIRESVMRQTGAQSSDVIVIYTAARNYRDRVEEFMSRRDPGIVLDVVKNEVLYYYGEPEAAVNEVAACASVMKAAKIRNKPQDVFVKWPVTTTLIALNVAAYAVTAVLSQNLFSSNIYVLIFLGAKVNSLIAAGEYWRLVTCMFLHGGLIHLAVNMYSLYAVGPVIENFFGKKKYLAIYFIAGVCSSGLSFYMTPEVSIGASGAIFGVLGACLVFAVKLKDRIGKEFLTNVITVIAVNLFLGFSISMVDNFGHIGGLIGGIASSFLLFKNKKQA
ncbi:MAG TPA: rhomboid family intramembrane serine protease [Clostridiaceae bacterium]|nr:rhomboid family intramembrane serine protease [Clostridiaceae bacterium]